MKKNYCLLLLIGMALFSCRAKTVYVPVETETLKKEYVDRWLRDSIFLHDSVYVERKGDTIWLEKYKTMHRERLVRDSVYLTDSITIAVPYPVVEVKEVNRLRMWQIVLMCLGGVLIGYLGLRVVRWVR